MIVGEALSETHRRNDSELEAQRAQRRSIFGQIQNATQKTASVPNRKADEKTVEQELENRANTALEQINIMRTLLATIVKQVANIPDKRNAKTIKHKLSTLMLYGILCFVFQMSSRREANRQMTTQQFKETLHECFPEIESMPHNDTLKRVLDDIDVNKIEALLVALVKRFIANKKFRKYLINNCYPIAIDGTEKYSSYQQDNEHQQERKVGSAQQDEEKATQYYIAVVEANLTFHNGLCIPLLSEFIDYQQGDQAASKQDCELNAAKRLLNKLKKYFPRLPIMIIGDGLYANGPFLQLCEQRHFDYMIVLKDASLTTVWDEAERLKPLNDANVLKQTHDGRTQEFWWANAIDYGFGANERQKLKLNLVVCDELWEAVDKENNRIIKQSRHAWLSKKTLRKANIHIRCNLAGRYRWGIEESNLKEKKQGYQYEKCFSHNWNSMRGYHALMRIGHFINEIVHHSKSLIKKVQKKTIRYFIKYVFETLKNPWLTGKIIREKLKPRYRYQLA